MIKYPSLSMALICFLLLVTAACGGAQAQTVINVKTFGAIGDGVADDTAAVNGAISAAVKAGPGSKVFFPAGKYLILKPTNGAHVHIDNATNVTIGGETGSEILADDPTQSIININNSTNTVIRNLVIEQDRYYFTQGTCVSMNPADHTIVLKLDNGYPPLDDSHLIFNSYWSIRVMDTQTSGRYIWPSFTRHPTGMKSLGGPLWQVSFDRFSGDPPQATDMNIIGKRVLVWDDHLGSHGITGSNDNGLTVDNVAYYGKGVNAGLAFGSCDGTLLFHKYVIGTPPGSLDLLSCSGGGQLGNIRGSLIYDHCDFERFDDDGADILSGFSRVLKQIDSTTLLLQSDEGYRAGDQVGVIDWTTKQQRVRTTITSVENVVDATEVHLADNVTAGNVGPGLVKSDMFQNDADGIDRFVDYSLVCKSVLFDHCTFQCNRARALNLKSQNTTIQNCVFFNCEMSAIQAGPETIWGELPYVNNLIIRNNRFYRCDNPNIEVGIYSNTSNSPSIDNRNIEIEGNRFDQFGSSGAISIQNASNVTIENNWFGTPEVPLSSGSKVIDISKSAAVTVSGNTGNSGNTVPLTAKR